MSLLPGRPGILATCDVKSNQRKINAHSSGICHRHGTLDLRADDTMVRSGGHVRIITDVDVKDDCVYFTTLESTTANASEHGQGVGERRWRFPNSESFKNLEENKSGQVQAI